MMIFIDRFKDEDHVVPTTATFYSTFDNTFRNNKSENDFIESNIASFQTNINFYGFLITVNFSENNPLSFFTRGV